jgi:hypothetical protein
MATTTNYGWTTPDDTALVKDGAAAIRSLGTAIDTSFAADEGDLLVGGTSDIFEALPIGAVGTVLTSDGDTAEWATPAAAAPSWSLLSTTATTGATAITVSSLSGYNQFLIRFIANKAGNTCTHSLRFNGVTASSYTYAGIFFNGAAAFSTNFPAANTSSATNLLLGNTAVSSNEFNGYLFLQGGNGAGLKVGHYVTGGNDAAANSSQQWRAFTFTDTNVISTLTLTSSSGNYTAGNIQVYGSVV